MNFFYTLKPKTRFEINYEKCGGGGAIFVWIVRKQNKTLLALIINIKFISRPTFSKIGRSGQWLKIKGDNSKEVTISTFDSIIFVWPSFTMRNHVQPYMSCVSWRSMSSLKEAGWVVLKNKYYFVTRILASIKISYLLVKWEKNLPTGEECLLWNSAFKT